MSSSVPRPHATLIGRDEVCVRVAALLASSRLVTLTGPGGIGKTSLARAVLADSEVVDRWFVDLTSARDERETPAAVAASLGLVVTEAEDAESALIAYLRPRVALLVLDNLEQLPGLGRRVGRWLDEAPDLRIVATSRLPLRTPGEVEHPVPGLDLPRGDSPAEVEASPAGALFLRTARRLGALDVVEPDMARDLAELLRRLDGMPLAIELAAGRSRVLTPSGLLRRLDDPTVVSSGRSDDTRDRHASLDRVLALTLDLLPAPERALLAALSVCPGSFDVDLAQALAPDLPAVPALDLLVSAGLVRPAGAVAGESRFRLLETIRSRAARELLPDDRVATLERHARATIGIAGRIMDAWTVDEPRAVALLTAEDENVAAAIEWAVDHDVAAGMHLLAAYDRLAQNGVHLERSVRWYRSMLAVAPADDPHRPLVLGALLRLLTRYAGPREALTLEAELMAAAADAPGPVRRMSYLRLAYAYYALGDVLAAARVNDMASTAADDPDDAAALRLDSEAARAWAVDHDAERAARLYGDSAVAAGLSGRVTNQAIELFQRALLELRAGHPAVAAEQARSALARCPPGNLCAFAGSILVLALAEQGDPGAARQALAAAWREVEREARIDRVEVLDAAVALLAAEGRHAAALSALAVADRERPSTGWVRDQHVEFVVGRWQRRAVRALGPMGARLADAGAASATIEGSVSTALMPDPGAQPGNGGRRIDDLTRREVEVLALVGRGRTDGEIAAELFISPKTASVHVTNIKDKLGLSTRVEVALRAHELGLLTSDGGTTGSPSGALH